jgi:putative copper export protein
VLPLVSTSVPPWWRTSTEFLYFAGLVPVIGGSLLYAAVVRPAMGACSGPSERLMRGRAARLLAALAPVLLVTSYLQLAGRVRRADQAHAVTSALSPAAMWRFLRTPAKPGDWLSSGTELLIQNVLFALVVALLLTLVGRGARRLDRIAPAVLLTAVVASSVNAIPTGPSSVEATLDSVLTQLHILGASTWVGGLVGLSALALSTRRHLPAEASAVWARIWQRFSVVAMSAVGTMVATGAWLAWRHVAGPGELLTTGYGRLLLAKLIAVLAMVGAGAYNQFRLTPEIARAHAAGDPALGFTLTLRRFPAVVTTEVALGTTVLLIVPFLTGSARAQHGDGPPPTVDTTTFGLGALLVAALIGSLYTAHRVSATLVRNPS